MILLVKMKFAAFVDKVSSRVQVDRKFARAAIIYNTARRELPSSRLLSHQNSEPKRAGATPLAGPKRGRPTDARFGQHARLSLVQSGCHRRRKRAFCTPCRNVPVFSLQFRQRGSRNLPPQQLSRSRTVVSRSRKRRQSNPNLTHTHAARSENRQTFAK